MYNSCNHLMREYYCMHGQRFPHSEGCVFLHLQVRIFISRNKKRNYFDHDCCQTNGECG
ncbi:hypothetical protein HanIR_Chr16g0813891 [Helianthus annuus]|nr:hypothetical protein HanIR_Chr16g0813891 [Helianthus annuus]